VAISEHDFDDEPHVRGFSYPITKALQKGGLFYDLAKRQDDFVQGKKVFARKVKAVVDALMVSNNLESLNARDYSKPP